LVRNARGAISNAIPLWIGAGRPAPMLDAVQPAQARDGQRVRLTGTGFRRVGGVLIGGGWARRVRVISSRLIVATVLGS
jgi:hypothetical protein